MNGSVSSTSAGRVEVCIGNVYGSVCNGRWDERDASVVCNQLVGGKCCFCINGHILYISYYMLSGSGSVVAIRDASGFGSSTVPIFIDDVVCEGSETNLLQCSYKRQQNCDLLNLAAVTCEG